MEQSAPPYHRPIPPEVNNVPVVAPQLLMEGARQGLQGFLQMQHERQRFELETQKMVQHGALAEEGFELARRKQNQDFVLRSRAQDKAMTLLEAKQSFAVSEQTKDEEAAAGMYVMMAQNPFAEGSEESNRYLATAAKTYRRALTLPEMKEVWSSVSKKHKESKLIGETAEEFQTRMGGNVDVTGFSTTKGGGTNWRGRVVNPKKEMSDLEAAIGGLEAAAVKQAPSFTEVANLEALKIKLDSLRKKSDAANFPKSTQPDTSALPTRRYGAEPTGDPVKDEVTALIEEARKARDYGIPLESIKAELQSKYNVQWDGK